MLGRDSLPLRIDLQAAIAVMDHEESNEQGDTTQQNLGKFEPLLQLCDQFSAVSGF